jgi:hypothetical protein
VLSIIKPSYLEVLGEYSHRRPKLVYGVQVDDSHPTPTEHYLYMLQVLPHLIPASRSSVEQLDVKLAEIWTSNYQGWTYIWPDKKKAKKEKRL